MKKQLLLLTMTLVFLALPSHGQSVGPNPGNITQAIAACDLNLPLLLPSVNSQCTVEFADLVIPVITDSCGNAVTPTTDGSIFPISATGTTTIVWEYVNELGGIETSNQNINILDFILPIPDVAILPNFNSQCAVQAADLPVPTATDNCSGVVTVANNGVFPITVSTLITWTYTDATGNTTFQDQDIYINDFTEPVPDVAILPNIHALCQVQQADVTEPTATDNCGGLVTVTSNVVFPILASTLITWTYSDANGNTSFQTQDIYIDDFTAPVADAVSLADVHALCQVDQVDLAVPTATDNCSVASVTNDGIFPIVASTTITWTYADPSGNTTFQTQNIIIDDATNPVPDVAVLADFISQCAVMPADLPLPTATDNCSVASVTNDGVFPIAASTTITWTYTDHNGNSDSQTQNIVINDTTAPTPDVAVLSDVLGQCEVLEADVLAPTATDNCSGVVTVTNDAVFPITVATMITWTYADANGNSTTQTQNVTIADTIPPTPDAALLLDVTGQCEVVETDVTAPTATDNCSAVTVTNDAAYPITASTTITWTYKDVDGNASTQSQSIIINDTTAPTPDAIVLADVTAACEVLEADIALPTATDNCLGIVTVTNDGAFPITTSTMITWTYTDANGNSNTQTQNIIINDTVAPTPDAAVLADVTGQCEVLEADVTVPTATDNCSGLVTVTNNGIFPITASTAIVWTYTDANGNSDSQSQNIIINDTTAPTPDVAILADVTAVCEVLDADVVAPTATDNCSGVVTVTNNGVFPITTSTTLTWTYTDANGNSELQTQNVVINDAIAPIPDVAVLADITAACEVLEADLIAPTATDNCSTVTVTNDGIFPITASTTITWTYTDANGNSDSQTQNVVINDITAPTPDVAALTDVIAQCEVLEGDLLVPTATDNCSVVTVTNDGTFPITASTTITWTYTDASANSVSQTQNIIVNDTTAPTPDAAVLADITAQCELLDIDVIAPTATDNCAGVVTVTNDGIFPITASTTITWTYTDANANSVTQTQNVVINDTTAPTPDAATLADVTEACEVLEADVAVPTATDNCSGVVTVSNDGVFPMTTSTTLTWTYTDINGNSSTQTQNIIINDTTAPTPDAASLADVSGTCEVLEADVAVPTATDNCSAVTVTHNGAFPITASTTITWTYTDANGNSETQTQNIIIDDATAPIPALAVLADITAQCEIIEADLIAPTATDNCSTVTVTNDGVFPITASTTLTWTYTDGNGNSATQLQNLVINDSTAPTPDNAILADVVAQCEVVEADLTAPTATDNCSAVTVTNNGVFPITTQGATTITWTYTDANGNTASQTQDILIGDNTPPTFTLSDITVSVNVAGIANFTAAQLENGTANDNCGVASMVVNPNTFTCTQLGINVVTVTVTDIHGNSTMQTASVTVNDPVDFCGALGVVQNEKAAFALYPNPTFDMIYIDNATVRSVSVYSLSGQLILEQSYKQQAERYSVSLESLAEGTYILKLQTTEGTFTKRVIKQ